RPRFQSEVTCLFQARPMMDTTLAVSGTHLEARRPSKDPLPSKDCLRNRDASGAVIAPGTNRRAIPTEYRRFQLGNLSSFHFSQEPLNGARETLRLQELGRAASVFFSTSLMQPTSLM